MLVGRPRAICLALTFAGRQSACLLLALGHLALFDIDDVS
jgi:hypothetical protein